MIDVYVTIRIRVDSEDQNYAEHLALDICEDVIADGTCGRPGVIETGVLMSDTNPRSEVVQTNAKGGE